MSRGSNALTRFIERFIHTESASGAVLAASTLVALIIANSPGLDLYFHVLNTEIFGLSFHHWINDGLMTIFFFVIGMEIKREIVAGELSSFKKAALPVFAAIGGMILPAAIYAIFNSGGMSTRGWAIPMATDIAFALGVLTFLGKRVPLSLKIFLLTFAIVDDLGAVLVIATFYTSQIRAAGIYIAGGCLLAALAARRFGLRSYIFYFPIGIILWFGVLYSGVHATIAGIMLGLITPYRLSKSRNSTATYSPIDELVHSLHPWVSFGVMPVFALANAGVSFGRVSPSSVAESAVSLGVFFGLLLGKPLGILLASYFVVRLKVAALPDDQKWRDVIGVACLAGIGFTMAIFITNLSLSVAQAVYAKIAILLASAISAGAGYLILSRSLEK